MIFEFSITSRRRRFFLIMLSMITIECSVAGWSHLPLKCQTYRFADRVFRTNRIKFNTHYISCCQFHSLSPIFQISKEFILNFYSFDFHPGCPLVVKPKFFCSTSTKIYYSLQRQNSVGLYNYLKILIIQPSKESSLYQYFQQISYQVLVTYWFYIIRVCSSTQFLIQL